MADRYYERGRELFASFEGFPDYWEILGVELKVEFEIGGRKFLGYIDLLVRDKRDGRLIVVDHKSKSEFKTPEEQAHYAIQLYLYAYWVYLNYGERPKELVFDMFRAGTIVTIPYCDEDQEAALSWFTGTIQTIYEDTDFWDQISMEYDAKNKPLSEFKKNNFFCNFLCGSKHFCGRSQFYQNF